MSEITLRACKPQDLNQVLRIEKACFPYPFDPPYPRSAFCWYLVRAPKGFIVACKRGSIIGYIISKAVLSRARIVSMAVAPEYQRQGVGRRLMEATISYLSEKKARKVSLDVRPSNRAALNLYHEFSFHETGKIKKGYYRGIEDAIVLAKEL